MRDMIWALGCAGLMVLAPMSAGADDAAQTSAETESGVDHQVRQIEELTEIGELAVVRMRRAQNNAASEAGPDDPAQMSAEDLLTGGFGEQRILTAEDDDEPLTDEAELAEEAPVTHGPDARPQEESQAEAGPLQAAIERNAALSGALEERGVDVIQVVGVEVRGTSVIVYLDETRG